ncbi:MAG: hypothetical protein J6T10_29425 [Methanobrevibacter sp.]|nr:hypothetical protein [Methanobrevibacter sp.]
MTNEEAIQILSKVTLAYEIGEVTITQKEINEALNMAIKALEQTERIAKEVKKEIRRIYCFYEDGLIYKAESEEK